MTDLTNLIGEIRQVLTAAKQRVAHQINMELVQTYWRIGQLIVEFEQQGSLKAEYGQEILLKLSQKLTTEFGKGFNRSNLVYMRLLYLAYPKSATLSHLLSWSHYIELLKLDDPLERSFYEKQAITENWSFRDLKRQKSTLLFHRFAVSKNADTILQLAQQGQKIKNEEDIIKSPASVR